MESQNQDLIATGSPAEVPNDPGWAYYLILLQQKPVRTCSVPRDIICYSNVALTFPFFFRKMFVGGLSWQTCPGKLYSFCLSMFPFTGLEMLVITKEKRNRNSYHPVCVVMWT